ncbi:glycoside hydrolase family 15 protein [Microlunatus sp. Y2014]|uniref:glycoside hydrolase family 15 protein n=1 Tax=Microlunatus sp. Y2014 TaxID=3418488 RepID=UPI003DA78A5B
MALIEDYALLGDLQTAALVGRDGSIDWLCLPRFDSPACFAKILHDEDAGFWRIAPTGAGDCTSRRYRGDTLVLESEWVTDTGTVRVIDFMPPRGKEPDLVRIVEGVSGTVEMDTQLQARFDYGHIVPWVRRTTPDQILLVAGPDALSLTTPVEIVGQDQASGARFTVTEGDRVPFVLAHFPSHLPTPRSIDAELALAGTVDYWHTWVSQLAYDGEWRDAVTRSLITLKALTYAPTGGIVAAATTSLPEELGGSRNWDYRYCWLRDTTFTLQALLGTGFVAEATAWRDWLLRAVAGDPADLQIMYDLHGARRIPELELDWLDGYEGSKPVRIGNGAAGQLQLDVWGEVLDGLHQGRTAGVPFDENAWQLMKALIAHLEDRWRDPDNGLWEVRGAQQHFVHSKVMCWVAFDRAIDMVERYGLDGPADRWRAIRDEIHAQVCEHGYDTERQTFTQFYGSEGLDAALLLIPAVGFLPWDDPRVASTVDAVQAELGRDGFVLRYHTHADNRVDGLPGAEGTFLICTYWLVDALVGIGRVEEARALFEKLLAVRNDLGLLSEEYDTVTGRLLGNVPQAFSHVGLVNAARHLSGDAIGATGRTPRLPAR